MDLQSYTSENIKEDKRHSTAQSGGIWTTLLVLGVAVVVIGALAI